MKILVTGGAGFIGSNLVLALEEKGAHLAVIDNLSSGNLKNLEGFRGELIEGDISRLNLRVRFGDKKFDIIFHQASITDTTFGDDEKMFQNNVEGFKKILNFALTTKTKLIYASSAGVYGRGKIPMNEGQKLSPLNSYALSKKMMDKIAKKEMGKNNIVIIGLRYFNVYGPKEKYKGKSASMIYQLARQMKDGRRPKIFKYGKQRRDFIYVEDIVEANLKAMTTEKSCIVNIGTGLPISFNRIIEILNQALGINYEPEYFDNPYNFYQDQTQADTYLASELLGFKANFCVEEGIKTYIHKLK